MAEKDERARGEAHQSISLYRLVLRGQGRARVGISVGSAVFGVDGETLDQLLVAADQAMYRAKSTHKAGVFREVRKQPASRKTATERADGPLVTTAIN